MFGHERRQMARAILAGIVIAAGGMTAGCGVHPDGHSLSAEDARRAVVELVSRPDAFEHCIGAPDFKRCFTPDRVRELERAEVAVSGGTARVGDFVCDLGRRTFQFSWFVYQLDGHFEYRDGRWVAVIDQSMHINRGPGGR
jgi:hypothetical protein